MKFKVQDVTADLSGLKSECLIVPVYTDKAFSKAVKKLDKALKSSLSAVRNSGDFSANVGEFLLLPTPPSTAKQPSSKHQPQRVVLLGFGKSSSASLDSVRRALAKMFAAVQGYKFKSAHLLLEESKNKQLSTASLLHEVGRAGEYAAYRYDATLGKKPQARAFASLTVLCSKSAATSKALSDGAATGRGMNMARELGNLPGNVCTPRYLAKQAQTLARKYESLKTKILNDKQLEALGMGSLLSVARGSKEPARLISMEYRGGTKNSDPVVLVGKGITFDTGGISLKPGAAMDEMKFDMCGAASVFGVIEALCLMKAKVNVVGLVAAAENMPGSQATKPGDVVTSMSGKTIEVLNTDAEGRLVLCDALSYAARYRPTAVIDIATLTGACVIALGHHASGLFSNNDDLAAKLLAAGEASGDKAWRLPIWDEYQEQLKSNFADLANIGGRPAGSITAACFLSQFAKDYNWAHIDIAGTAWHSGARKGATGKPVPLLLNYLLQ
ncbi:MAG: leucyl aminopeptidase [Pseudomonadales bacterium]